MSFLPRTSLSLITLAWIYYHLDGHLRRANPVIADGRVDTGYESVREAFLKNFEDGWEHEGASLAVFVDGKPVVDLWGGHADGQAARKWKEDTISVTFSTTKAVAAACIALLVDRGRLSYDDLVSKHWPGFAKNGKENVTVHQVLAHMGGLGYINAEITEEIARDHVAMRQIIENEEPKWKPGSAIGYHPYTYGWLVDQLVRHTDEKARGIGQFLREEITGPYGIDYHIGLPFSEAWRVARLHTPTMWERVREVFHNWRVLWCFRHLWSLQMDTPLSRAVNNPNWLQAVHRATYNNPEYHNMEQAAALGIGNARSLAQIFNLFVTEKLVGHKILKHLEQHYANDEDIIFGGRSTKGHGFFYLPLDRAGTQHLIGHTGHGCQNVGYDLKNRIVIAYVTNGLKTGVYDLCRNYIRLQHAVYDVIEKNLHSVHSRARLNHVPLCPAHHVLLAIDMSEEDMFNKAPFIARLVASSVRISESAGNVIKEIMQNGPEALKIRDKSLDGTPDLQTEADRQAQYCIVQSLLKRYSKLKIVGEEEVVSECDILESTFDKGPLSVECSEELKAISEDEVVVWVDPLDGTGEVALALKNKDKALLEQVTVLIGIAYKDRAIAGIIHQPYYNQVGRTIWAIEGCGINGLVPATNNEKKVVVTTRSHLSESVLAALKALEEKNLVHEVRKVGGAGYKVLQVLEGSAAYVFASQGCKKWDTCAVEAVLNASGGHLTDISGRRLRYHAEVQRNNTGGVLATASWVSHQSYLDAIPQVLKDSLPEFSAKQ